jgi:hypothetical protein
VPNEVQEEFTGIREEQVIAFETLLNSMYHNPVAFDSMDHLVNCTELAGRYRCVPSFSRALEGGLLRSPELVFSFREECCKLLEIAMKLKHKLLFKEALIHVLCPWHSPRYIALTDQRLLHVATKAHIDITDKIKQFNSELRDEIVQPPELRDIWYNLRNRVGFVVTYHTDDHGQINFPAFFRTMADQTELLDIPPWIHDIVKPLAANKLRFDTSNWKPGEKGGPYHTSFLCADIEDEDLPWEEDDPAESEQSG